MSKIKDFIAAHPFAASVARHAVFTFAAVFVTVVTPYAHDVVSGKAVDLNEVRALVVAACSAAAVAAFRAAWLAIASRVSI